MSRCNVSSPWHIVLLVRSAYLPLSHCSGLAQRTPCSGQCCAFALQRAVAAVAHGVREPLASSCDFRAPSARPVGSSPGAPSARQLQRMPSARPPPPSALPPPSARSPSARPPPPSARQPLPKSMPHHAVHSVDPWASFVLPGIRTTSCDPRSRPRVAQYVTHLVALRGVTAIYSWCQSIRWRFIRLPPEVLSKYVFVPDEGWCLTVKLEDEERFGAPLIVFIG